MNIGVFTATDNEERLQKLLNSFEGVTFEFFPYEKVKEVTESFRENARFLDGYLFSGYLSYLVIRDEVKTFDKPVAYLRMSEADFYKKLIYIMLNNRDIDLSRVFLDFHAESEQITEFIKGLPDNKQPYIAEDKHIYVTEDVYDRAYAMHQDFHNQGKVDVSFTRLANIVHDLAESDVPYYYFDISDGTIEQIAEELIQEVDLHLLQDNQIVSGAIRVRFDKNKSKDEQMHTLFTLLEQYNDQERHELMILENEDFLEVMTNYYEVETLTNNFTSSALLHFLQEHLTESIHVGWGIGKTLTQARMNAQTACNYSYNNEVNSAYIIKDEGVVIGPLVGKKKEGSALTGIISMAEIVNLSERINMTRDKLNKIFLAFTNIENEAISSSLFAEAVGLSIRSANRILKEAEENKLVIATIDTDSGLQGRPRKLYRLNREIL